MKDESPQRVEASVSKLYLNERDRRSGIDRDCAINFAGIGMSLILFLTNEDDETSKYDRKTRKRRIKRRTAIPRRMVGSIRYTFLVSSSARSMGLHKLPLESLHSPSLYNGTFVCDRVCRRNQPSNPIVAHVRRLESDTHPVRLPLLPPSSSIA